MDSPTSSQVETTTSFSLGTDVGRPAAAERSLGSAPRPDWVDEARETLPAPGRYIAYEESGRRLVVPLGRALTRIGRSQSAELRFDDATVSRRHAVVAAAAEGVRVLDDRSLNGVYVNGHRVEACPLRDGDEIGVGRHCLWFFDSARVGEAVADAPVAGIAAG